MSGRFCLALAAAADIGLSPDGRTASAQIDVLTKAADEDLAGNVFYISTISDEALSDVHLELPTHQCRPGPVRTCAGSYWRAVYKSHALFARKGGNRLPIVRIRHPRTRTPIFPESCFAAESRPYAPRESGGRSIRQPGQIRKEAAVTKSVAGRSGSHPSSKVDEVEPPSARKAFVFSGRFRDVSSGFSTGSKSRGDSPPAPA